MELSAIQCFVKVVQTGSFTRAAEALQTQKAHVSRVVSQLEAGLGVRLLERSTRSLSLTEMGREFYERALGILASVDDAQRAMQKSQDAPRGNLKLTCGVEFGMIAVNDWIAQFLAQHPAVRVDADFTSRVVDIVHEGYDLAIRLGRAQRFGPGRTQAGRIALRPLCRTGLPDPSPSPHQPSRTGTAHPAGVHRWAQHRAMDVGKRRRSERITVEPRLRANNVFAVRDAAIRGLGVVQLPIPVARPALNQGTLQCVLPGWARAPVPVHAVFASARYLTPKVRPSSTWLPRPWQPHNRGCSGPRSTSATGSQNAPYGALTIILVATRENNTRASTIFGVITCWSYKPDTARRKMQIRFQACASQRCHWPIAER